MVAGNLVFLLGQVQGFEEVDFPPKEPLAVVVVRTAPSQEGGHHRVLAPVAMVAPLQEAWERSGDLVEVWVLGQVRQEGAGILIQAVRLERVS